MKNESCTSSPYVLFLTYIKTPVRAKTHLNFPSCKQTSPKKSTLSLETEISKNMSIVIYTYILFIS